MTHKIKIETSLECTTSDGTILRSDVYRPDAPGKFPVILERTPYDKTRENFQQKGPKLAEQGFLYVVQDVRGRYSSDGDFMPGFYSSNHRDDVDGYDTVEWAAALPWSTGKVGTTGGSYDGWTQLELAHMQPPSLKAINPQVIAANLLDREKSAVLRLGRVLWWSMNTLSPDARVRANHPTGPRTTDAAEEQWTNLHRSKWMWYLPLIDIPDESMFGIGPHWRKWLSDHATDHFDFERKHERIAVPALSQTGWYDQQIGTIKNFTGLSQNAPTKLARDNQYLIIGPWSHDAMDWPSLVGEIDFGTDAHLDYFEITSQWYRRWLYDDVTAIEDWPKIRLFVMGANVWRHENEWPLTRTKYTNYYFHQVGGLSQEIPGAEPPDKYVYDPRDPVMTLYSPGGQQEPYDQRALDGRHDVLTYSTPPLQTGVEVTGPITVNLHATSSARDTDFVVKLQDVWPNGFVQEISHGIVRARYRESFDKPTLIEPGVIYEYQIEMNPTSNFFMPGHRIRVDVTSSDFPNFDRNHNTGGDDYSEEILHSANQTVLHDNLRPSHIVLPIIP